jgi:GNAT superfamily N-acetyltransferase
MFRFEYDRDSAEYVYSVENMANLPGKKFHGKKGHVNAFFRNHEDIHIDPITEDNIHLCLEIQKSWLSDREENLSALDKENLAIEKAVRNFDKLGFEGAILFADGKAVAFTMGEPLKNDTFCTHYEKTLPDYRDAFPVINNGFTKLMLTNYKYVNREEDTGAEGLRKAKMSYYPEFLLDKYSATLKNDPMRKYYVSQDDYPELISLWQTVFGDREETIRYFLENAVETGDIFAEKINGKIVSAFYLVNATLVSGNKEKNVKYLYAAATLPEYRKQGIMSKMIKYAAEYVKQENTGYIALCPADESLYDYYEKLGFVTSFTDRIYTIDSDKLESFKSSRYFNTNISYHDIRNYIPSLSYLKFTEGYLDYARHLASKYGFEINSVFDDEDKVFVTGYKKDNTVYVDEAISQDGNYNHILSVLSDIDCEKILLKTPVDIEIEGFMSEIRKSGMLLPLSEEELHENIYLGQPCL